MSTVLAHTFMIFVSPPDCHRPSISLLTRSRSVSLSLLPLHRISNKCQCLYPSDFTTHGQCTPSCTFFYFLIPILWIWVPNHPTTCYQKNSIYQGAGNCVSPRIIAVPTLRGQLTIFSKNSAACLIMGKRPSKEMRTTHHQAQNHEMGHAMKTRSRSQRML